MATTGATIALVLCLAGVFAPAAQGALLKARAGVTPIEKVVSLLEGLISEVESDGSAEGETYNEFACFCKDKTTTLSSEILANQDTINQLSAEIEEKTAQKAQDEDSLVAEKAKLEELTAELEKVVAEGAKAKAAYEANDADLVKAIGSIKGAIEALESSKPAAAGSAAAAGLVTIKANIQKSLALADAMKLLDDGPKWQQVSAFLQGGNKVNPDDPEYKYHSQAIIEVLSKLETQFEAAKKEADEEEAARVKTYEETVAALEKEIELSKETIASLEESIATLTEEIATARKSLVMTEADLKDNKLYLTDLTEMCEKRAQDWDQRTSMRSEELANLKKALALLTDVVMEKDAVNVRAFLQQHAANQNGTAKVAGPVNKSSSPASASKKVVAARSNGSAPKAAGAAPAFLQTRLAPVHRTGGNLRAQGRGAAFVDTKDRQVRKDRALALLAKEGARMGSAAMSALATKAMADPFLKVKELIQKLIERLIHEATEEATKKGFCDTELGKNEKDREYRMEEVMKLNTELASLEAKRDFLELEITELEEALDVLYVDLNETTAAREKEKADNMQILETAKEGAVAVAEAILILKSFYKEAAKVQSLAQEKASPLEEDTTGAGFEGKYAGKQDAMKGIIGILDVIKSDFARTLRKTAEAEKQAQADFVIYERNTKADIASKETKVALDKDDLATTKATIEQKMLEMQNNMDLVDAANKALEALKPMCIDSGMSYEERVAKREEEIQHLQEAVCILDENGVEPGC